MRLSVRWTSVKNSQFILPFVGVKNETVNSKIEAAHKIRTARQTLEQSSTVLQPTNTCIPPPNSIPPPTYTACKSIVDVCHKILFIFSEGSGF